MLYVVTGPEKSGKSARAEQLAGSLGKPVIYLATMIPYGEQGRKRIERHRQLRAGKGFQLIECTHNVDQIETDQNTVVLLECLLNLAANELFDQKKAKVRSEDIVSRLEQQLERLAARCADLIVVTSEMELRSDYDEETKVYIQVVNQVNRYLTKKANQVITIEQKDTPYFPLFMNLANKKVVIVGAGTVAARRAAVLAGFCTSVSVIAPEGCQQMRQLDQNGQVHWERRIFEPTDLLAADLVIAATNQTEVNDLIGVSCRQQGIIFNHAGDHSQCDFYFPGIARNDGLVMGITASGKDHRLVKKVTKAAQVWLKHLIEEQDGI